MGAFPIVGIGSSAGGLEALQTLLQAMPEDGGLGFVIAAHLDPTQKSFLAELLGRCTGMPVVQIEDRIKVEPNHVYVIAPDQELAIKDGVLQPAKPALPRGHRHPVDAFFRSLAEDQGERAIAIVLSGTGTNGSLGLRFIKAEGGIAIAQEPETAGFQGMPRSAVATGIVDLVLPPAKMPEALLGLVRHPYVSEPAKVDAAPPPEDQLKSLFALLRDQTKRDFAGYKQRTLLRRIHRRMGLHRITELAAYVDRLRRDGKEVKALAEDLTINVTGFFRDPEAWDELAEAVIAPLVRVRPNDTTIRAWVPGCSTGEEAYSIAMLLVEQAEAAGKRFAFRLFATDVADSVLSSARSGTFPGSVALDVGEERLQRFFELQDDSYAIRKTLREAITFAPQNLLRDPPFSRLDLVSCRNLLIYLEPDYQKRVLGLFHFALREGGHLFLGPAETISGQEDLFQPISKRWRIFRRLEATRHNLADFPIVRDGQPARAADGDPAVRDDVRVRSSDLMLRALAERYAPASALIDASYHVHYLRGPTGDYLQPPSGEPSFNLLAMARDGLQMPLRAAVRQALDEDREVAILSRVRRGGELQPVRLVVTPLTRGSEAARLLVGFFEREVEPDETAAEVAPQDGDGELRAELDSAREDLRLTIEQMEAANEELKASNEEIRSINEEMQASNEELETSKEELNTVNNQLQAKVGELEERTADLNNLLNSTDIATLFLDRALCVRWFTPAMKALFELLPTDIGRPIAHFAQRVDGDHLQEDAKAVLAKLMPIDKEVVSDHGRWYLRHIAPYRTDDDRIAGVVVTFTDITERKRSEAEIDRAKDFAESIVDTVREPLLVLTPDLKVLSANQSFYRRFRVRRAETEGRSIYELGNRQWEIPALRRLLEDILPADKQFNDFQVTHEFETIGHRTMLLNGRKLDDVQLILLAIDDVTERERAEAAVRRSEERLRKVLETDAVGVLFLEEATGTLVDANDVFLRMTGYKRSEIESRALSWQSLTPPEWVEATRLQLEKVAETGRLGPYEKEYLCKDGSKLWMLFAGASLDDGTIVEYGIDISDRKRAEAEREMLAHELSHRVKNTLAVVQALATQTNGGTASIDEYRQTFLGRLQAMAQAHSLLLEANWQRADLRALAEQAVAAYCVDHPNLVEVEGEAVTISPKQGLGLSLILHELGTNAAKYGALSRHEGRLLISWNVEQTDRRRQLHLHWHERHGPAVAPPDRRGFGTSLIEQAASYELEGEARLDYAPEGLTCEVSFPLD